LLQLLGGIIYSFVLNYRINRVYPWLKTEIKRGKSLLKQYPDITKYIKQIFVHKVGGFVQFELSPFLVYSFVSLPMVAIYANYTILTDKLNNLIQGVLDSTMAGVGNLISEGNSDKLWDIYKQLLSIRFFVVGICCSCFYYLSNGFIDLWLGKEYELSSTTILLITITLFLRLVRGATDQFINGFGLFYDVWSPIAEASIFVVASVLFGSIWGLNGILLGPIISMVLIIHMWKPYFLFRKGLKRSLWLYIQLVAFFVLSIAISYIVTTVIISLMCLEPVTWMSLLLCSILFVACYSTILFGLFYSLSLNFRHITKEIVQQTLKKK
jgi:O-antigen/teichoic acid export membrane protein